MSNVLVFNCLSGEQLIRMTPPLQLTFPCLDGKYEDIPVPVHGTVVAPKELLELVACGCKSVPPCSRANCSCQSAGVSCTSCCKCEAKLRKNTVQMCIQRKLNMQLRLMRKKNWTSLWQKRNQRTKGSGDRIIVRHSVQCWNCCLSQKMWNCVFRSHNSRWR